MSAADTAAALAFEDLRIEYRPKEGRPVLAVDRVQLTIARGEFVSVVGPSGCGKSTLLKAAIGLLRPTEGEVSVLGQPVRGVPRAVGLMFQADTLLPWARAIDNVTIGLALGGVSVAEREERALQLLALVGLGEFAGRFPSALSGGMRKRVQLARLLAYDPDVLLMDEPFGSLDAQTKIQLGREFLAIWQRLGKTVLFVTHDLEEAIALSDRVVVMTRRPGRIRAVHPISLPRPRDYYEVRLTEEFRSIHERIWRDLASEVESDISPALS